MASCPREERSMRSLLIGKKGAALGLLCLLGVSAGASGQNDVKKDGTPAAKAAAPAQPDAPALRAHEAGPEVRLEVPIVVEGLTGSAQHRAEGGRWIDSKQGDRLSEGMMIRVDFRSAVTIRIAEVQQLTFDHEGRYTIRLAYNDGKTNI